MEGLTDCHRFLHQLGEATGEVFGWTEAVVRVQGPKCLKFGGNDSESVSKV
jgi:hypothetical protein